MVRFFPLPTVGSVRRRSAPSKADVPIESIDAAGDELEIHMALGAGMPGLTENEIRTSCSLQAPRTVTPPTQHSRVPEARSVSRFSSTSGRRSGPRQDAALKNRALKQSAGWADFFTERYVYFLHSSRPLLSYSLNETATR
jgi:hypothetical protein